MNQYKLQIPHNVYAGENSLSILPDILKQNNVGRPVIFTDKGIRGAGLLDLVQKVLPKPWLNAPVLDDLPAEPTYEQAQNLVDKCKELNTDFIIAVGGGSVMDTAKLASILLTDKLTIHDLLDNPLLARKCCKTLMIPTTSGTGSEATPNAIVAVPEKELKVGIVNPEMISDYVILDAVMTKNLPRKIAAATGIDALTHAIECFTSNKANPISDMFALRALEMIFSNIIPACDDKNAMEAKRSMLLASFYAGIAITSSGTTAVHALSYPLGGKYHIPHGVSNAILLAPVMKFNKAACSDKLAEVYDRCFKGENAADKCAKADFIINNLEGILAYLDIPSSLKEFGVSSDDLESLVEAGMQVTRLLNNNMKTVNAEDARELYKQIL